MNAQRESNESQRAGENGGGAGEERGEGEVEAEVYEEAKIREVRDPGCPTYEERERHNKTHCPTRAWCPICCEAKGIEDPHHKADPEREYELPGIALDYKSFGQSAPGEGDKGTSLVFKDCDTKTIYGHLVTEK